MAPQDSVSATQQERSPALVSVDGRTYPLCSAHIRGRAEGGLAQSTLVQVFHNPHAEPLEVLYTMPLPADGAVLGYTVRIGERVIRGEIQPREKAEAEYKEALYKGRTAGLLEQDRADTFQQRLGNVPPNTDVQVEVDVLHPLAFLAAVDDNGPFWEYRFPTVVSVRYEGAPGRVTDKDRLDVDRAPATEQDGIPTRFGVSLTVADDVIARGGIVSPSHEVHCVANATGVHVTLPEDARLDRDLVLRWPAALDEVGVRLVEGRGLPGDDGRYALLTITPPKLPRASFPRDLTVLIDASGSMSGDPIETAKRIVTGLLESLEPEDRFEVLAFASKPRELTHGVEFASPKAVKRVVGEIEKLEADGGTEMLTAFQKALAPLRRDSQRQIVLVTDGQIGFEAEVITKVGASLPSGVRVHAIGIGAAVNRTLTSQIARAGRGVELIAGGLATADETSRRACAATVRPILTELMVTGSGYMASAPQAPRDVLAGQPIVIAAELKAEGGTVKVVARMAGSKDTWAWSTVVPPLPAGTLSETEAAEPAAASAAGSTPLPIGALYGREAIADMEARPLRHGRDVKKADDAVEALGMRHRITSYRTSLVAIAEEPSVDPLAPRRRERLAVEIPHGLSAEGVGLMKSIDYGSLARSVAQPGVAEMLGRFKSPFAKRLDVTRDLTLGRIESQVVGFRPRLLIGEALSIQDSELTLEFEVGEEGFHWPEDDLDVTFHDSGVATTAVVVPEKSAKQGPHARGTRIRVTLRLTDGSTWPDKGHVTIEWPEVDDTTRPVAYRLVVKLDIARRARADA